MTQKYRTKFVHVGEYAARVDVRVMDTEDGGSPSLSLEDIYKIEEVRE